MSPGGLIIADDATDKIAALISRLQETEQQLEELTGGEVDTVTDGRGQVLVLRRAQEHLRLHEAARQVAILNALPAHIALLDGAGFIISVNEAWQQFSEANLLLSPGHGIGLNYLRVCETAQGTDAAQAQRAAAGIRDVLAGKIKTYSIEYPCHSPTEQRWFLMTVTLLADDGSQGVVVMHVDMTSIRNTEANLRVTDSLFQEMANSIHDVFFIRDTASGQVLYISPAYEEIWGRSCASLYANPQFWIDAIHPEDRELSSELAGEQAVTKQFKSEYRILRPDGSMRWIESRGVPVAAAEGKAAHIAGIARDITERKQADDRIIYLNRIYAVLSGINSLIVRATDLDSLFTDACAVAVKEGGFRMAMIAVVDEDTGHIVPVAFAGRTDKLRESMRNVLISASSQPLSMVAHAMREKKAMVANDARNDARVLFSAEYSEGGVRSLAIIPLLIADKVVGMLGLYAGETGFFQQEEMELLGGLAEDIAFAIDHLEKNSRLNYLAYYDELTGLANRTLFLERLALQMRSASAEGNKMALVLIDLERFRYINESLGRPAGDALLKQVAQLLTSNVKDASRVGRVGADHFAVLYPDIKSHDAFFQRVEVQTAAFMEHPFRFNDASFRLAVKVGIAKFPEDGTNVETLLSNAEAALKTAKRSNNRYQFYTQSMNETVVENLALENRLRGALDKQQFELYYQPKVSLRNGKLTGIEALIRWHDPETGLVMPGRFIPMLEETGLIGKVGNWALRTAVADYLRWRAAGLPVVRIAVNVSPMQLRNANFIDEIKQVLGTDEHAAEGLELEITESLIMESVRDSIDSLKAIRAMNVTIAIDDFGTGFSSLSYLAKLPVDTLKIDRAFVIELMNGPEGLALVSTIINLAHSLRLKVVAEGVETDEQSRLLHLLGCDEMQGYLFSKPVPADIFEQKFLQPSNIP